MCNGYFEFKVAAVYDRFTAITMNASDFSNLSVPDPLCLHSQSNSLLPESLRNSDKRRNGPEFSNDTKKRKVEDKDSSHYVRSFSVPYVSELIDVW